jgi:hypothetical protein
MPVMTTENHDQPTAREILDAVLHSQDVLASAIGRLERRIVRIDDRLSSVEDLRLRSVLNDHERRITRLEGF